jgi:antibiotic biosynthesis monooxygenase (ABM) superfamily enzyme
LWLVAPLYGNLPFLLRTAITSALLVCAMTYFVMPPLARRGERWLYESGAEFRQPRKAGAKDSGD